MLSILLKEIAAQCQIARDKETPERLIEPIEIAVAKILKNPRLNKVEQAKNLLEFFRPSDDNQALRKNRLFETIREALKERVRVLRNPDDPDNFSLNTTFIKAQFEPALRLYLPYLLDQPSEPIAIEAMRANTEAQKIVLSPFEQGRFKLDFLRSLVHILPGEIELSSAATVLDSYDCLEIFLARLKSRGVDRRLADVLVALLRQNKYCAWTHAVTTTVSFFEETLGIPIFETPYGIGSQEWSEKIQVSQDGLSARFVLSRDYSRTSQLEKSDTPPPCLTASFTLLLRMNRDNNTVELQITADLFPWENTLREILKRHTKAPLTKHLTNKFEVQFVLVGTPKKPPPDRNTTTAETPTQAVKRHHYSAPSTPTKAPTGTDASTTESTTQLDQQWRANSTTLFALAVQARPQPLSLAHQTHTRRRGKPPTPTRAAATEQKKRTADVSFAPTATSPERLSAAQAYSAPNTPVRARSPHTGITPQFLRLRTRELDDRGRATSAARAMPFSHDNSDAAIARDTLAQRR